MVLRRLERRSEVSEDLLKGRKPFRVSEKLRKNAVSRIKRLLEHRDEVLLAFVFGSFVERDFARDLDLAVYLAHGVDELEALEYSEKLSKEVEKEIGLPVDVVVLNGVDEGLLMRVILNGEKIVVRDPLLYHKLRMLALEVKNRFLLKPKNQSIESSH